MIDDFLDCKRSSYEEKRGFFEDIAFELEKETSKSKFLPFVLLAIIGFSIVGAVFDAFYIAKTKSKQPVSQSSQIISPIKKLEDKKTWSKKTFAEVLQFTPEKSDPFLWTVDKAVSLPMDKDKGGAEPLEDVLKNLEDLLKLVHGSTYYQIMKSETILVFSGKIKTRNIAQYIFNICWIDGVYKLTSKFFNLSSMQLKGW